MRLLVVSPMNNPEWESVDLVGYKHAAALAKLHRVTLVTEWLNREGHERAPRPFAETLFIRQSILGTAHRKLWLKLAPKGKHQLLMAFYAVVHLFFEWHAWRRLKPRLKAGEFDAVIRLTPVSPIVASPMAAWLRRIGVPFVYGPINGGLPWPKGFSQASEEREWISSLRDLAMLLPYSRSCRHDATAVIAGSRTTWGELQAQTRQQFFLPENGIDDDVVRERTDHNLDRPLRLVCLGRLVPIKAWDVAIAAAAPLIKATGARLRLIGDGPLEAELRELARTLGVADQVEFAGRLPHAQVMRELAQSDVLLFPSLREFGGGAVCEALATGAVPIVSDFGGPADLVRDHSGIRVPLENPEQHRQGFERALRELDGDRQRLRQLSIAGQADAREHLTWSGKARQTTAILRWAVDGGEPPNLLPPADA